ncbi:McrC family protein [Photobacterium sanguinicancri]|uniref:McrC family protein n=1 Tax=Photobacterium sanguinicancri TaxID=875932 RepID=UPI003D0CDB5D
MVKPKKEITVFEFDFVAKAIKAERGTSHPNVHTVTAKSYDYLKQMCLGEKSDRKLFKLRSIDGMEVLQVQNYAGVIFTPDKTQIEVLPKIGRHLDAGEQGIQQARLSLITMLRALKGFEHVQTASANITAEKMPLLEVFITQFLQSVNYLVKRGLRSDYARREDNLSFLKGKLNIGKQLRHNLVNKHKLYCEYDEFLLDRPANRLLHSALQKVKALTRSVSNQKLLQELAFVFHDIPKSQDHQTDFIKLKLDRSMGHYQVPMQWCQLILNGYSPQSMKGATHAASLLFPMEKVFEDYVAKTLKDQLANKRSDLQLETQASGKHLAVYQGKGKFSLRPDLLIKRGMYNKVVLDTKWKLLDSDVYNANISQSDIYQMFAYAKKYLSQGGGLEQSRELQQGKDVVLIYPMQPNFKQALPDPFDLDDGHRLWVVPFDIVPKKSQCHWAEALLSSDESQYFDHLVASA